VRFFLVKGGLKEIKPFSLLWELNKVNKNNVLWFPLQVSGFICFKASVASLDHSTPNKLGSAPVPLGRGSAPGEGLLILILILILFILLRQENEIREDRVSSTVLLSHR